jgi:hypothetical protein
LLLPFWEERDENEPRLTVLDARGMGRRAREDDAGDDCKKDGDGLKASVDMVVVGASDDRGRKREREREREGALSRSERVRRTCWGERAERGELGRGRRNQLKRSTEVK